MTYKNEKIYCSIRGDALPKLNEKAQVLINEIQNQMDFDNCTCPDSPEIDIHQIILDIGYTKWQNDPSIETYSDMLNNMTEKYGLFSNVMIHLGKLNQQVCNGGFIQYYNNGYSGGMDHDLLDTVMKYYWPMIDEYRGECSASEILVLKQFWDILVKFLSLDIDQDRKVEEEYYDEDTDETLMDLVENPEYGEFDYHSKSLLPKLDDEYYAINDTLLIIYTKIINNFINKFINQN